MEKEAANRTAFMENVGKTVSDRNLCTTVFNCWEENAKMPGVMAEEIVVLKDGEVLTRTKGMLGISQEELSETKEFFVLLPNDIFDREESSNIL